MIRGAKRFICICVAGLLSFALFNIQADREEENQAGIAEVFSEVEDAAMEEYVAWETEDYLARRSDNNVFVY